MLRPEPTEWNEKAWLAVALNWIAGFVDTVGYLLLHNILSANMSGNTVEFGYGVAVQHWSFALPRGWTLLMFVSGLFLCAFIHEAGKRLYFLSTAAMTLGLEAVLLLLFIFYGRQAYGGGEFHASTPSMFYLLLAFPALAMGLQNATLTRVGALTVRTTHITGTISKFAEASSIYIFWFYDRTRGRFTKRVRKVLAVSPRDSDFRDAALTASLWLGFLLGGISGVYVKLHWQLMSFLLPVALLLGFVALDIVHPFTAPVKRKLRKNRS